MRLPHDSLLGTVTAGVGLTAALVLLIRVLTGA